MSWGADQWAAFAAIVASVVGVLGLVWTVRSAAGKQRDDEQRRRDDEETRRKAEYERGVTEGTRRAQSRIDLLTSQRDDARHDRDVVQAQCDEAWRRYNDLLERRGGET